MLYTYAVYICYIHMLYAYAIGDLSFRERINCASITTAPKYLSFFVPGVHGWPTHCTTCTSWPSCPFERVLSLLPTYLPFSRLASCGHSMLEACR